jgi:leucyl-tRNA synthetase
MNEKYFAEVIEGKWQRKWKESGAFEVEADASKPKFYCLEMLPYPSGRLHMGHVRNYSIGDAMSWYKRLQGYNVLHPIGWDSFGQPAEQAAIKKGVNPREWTEDNINQMRAQLQRLGVSYDWRREIAAHRPDYYKFDQWFFLKMYELGLAYKKMTKVNWCPRDQTTLSNEQASGGVCWRCGSPVEKKDLAQWFLRITAYAEELLGGMAEIEAGWAERVMTMQRNWIGRSEGAFVEFKVQGSKFKVEEDESRIRVFTTRIDTIYGANAIVVAASHPIIESNFDGFTAEVKAKIENIKTEQAKPTDYGEEVEKDGVDTGLKATNPFSGEALPVWVGNYVMMEYGTGAVMSVPAHDERDFEFAQKFNLPVKQVISPKNVSTAAKDVFSPASEALSPASEALSPVSEDVSPASEAFSPASEKASPASEDVSPASEKASPTSEKASPASETSSLVSEKASLVSEKTSPASEKTSFAGEKTSFSEETAAGTAETSSAATEAFTAYGVLINSGEWAGKTSEAAMKEMAKFAAGNGFGEATVTYRLRDWGISRQRFWGAPIPIIYCERCGTVPVSFDELPVKLPESAPFTGVGESPLARVPEFVNVACPNCGGDAKRETDTMDTFVDSSWYYFRYADPHNEDLPFAPEKAAYWLPVDQYIGGVDHAVMHLLYTRFWTKVMRDIGLVDFDEPVTNLLTQGMVVGESYYSEAKSSYLPPEEVLIERDERGKILSAKLKTDDSTVKVAVEKMSKSKYNGVDPDDMVSIYGADAVRIFALFAAPAENELVWQETGIDGAVRFLQRVYRFVYRWHEALSGQRSTSGAAAAASSAATDGQAKKLRQKTHQTIKRVTENFESYQFNTPVAALMELSNALGDYKIEPQEASEGDLFAIHEALKSLILMLAPYAPHVAEELWEVLTGSAEGILASGARFPVADENWTRADEIEIPVQVNGKLRSRVAASPDATDEELREMALSDAKIKDQIDGKEIVKVIVVPKRLVNVVVKN